MAVNEDDLRGELQAQADLLLELIKAGVIKNEEEAVRQDYDHENIAIAFSRYELEQTRLKFPILRAVKSDSEDPDDSASSLPISATSSTLSTPNSTPPREGSRSSCDSPVELLPGSPASGFASPLAKRLITAEKSFNGSGSVMLPSPLLQLPDRVLIRARDSKHQIDLLQQQAYSRRIKELIDFITDQNTNPKYKMYYDQFTAYPSRSDVYTFILSEVTAFVNQKPGTIPFKLMEDIERDLNLKKKGEEYPATPIPRAHSENIAALDVLEFRAAERTRHLFLYITNPLENPDYKEKLKLFQEFPEEKEASVIGRVRELVESYVNKTLEMFPFPYLMDEIFNSIERELNFKKSQEERTERLYQFMTVQVKTLPLKSPELEESLAKFPKLDAEDEGTFNTRILSLIRSYVKHSGQVPSEQFIAFLKIEREVELQRELAVKAAERLPASRKLF